MADHSLDPCGKDNYHRRRPALKRSSRVPLDLVIGRTERREVFRSLADVDDGHEQLALL